MKREYKLFLKDIIENIDLIQDFVKDLDYDTFIRDDKTMYAVSRSLEIIGEAVSKVPYDIQNKHKEVAWQDIKNFRNVVIHKYWVLDTELIWDVIENHIQPLRDQIKHVLDSEK